MTTKAWVDLQSSDFRNMLISLIGYRFGAKPEERLDEIRAERSLYAEGFLQLAGIKPSDTVVEIGSGCGFGTAAIARRAREVIACDISPAFLECAKQECAGLDNVRFMQVTSRDLSAVEDHSVNAVVAISVFIHLNLYDIYLYFKEFSRILRPGGKVVFDFADMNRLFSRLRGYGNNDLFVEHAGYYRDDPSALPALIQWNSARGITGIARAAGFRRLKRRGHKLLFGI
jgi:ubiquinone/menaquinone biosynthesis C-methylase UbiE